MSLPRLPMSLETRRKIADALRGRKKSTLTRLRMARAKKGKPLSEEHREAISRARRDPEATAARKAREAKLKEHQLILRQLTLDLRVAMRLQDRELYQDLLRSKGHWRRRKCAHPEVSNGWDRIEKRFPKYPFLNRLKPWNLQHQTPQDSPNSNETDSETKSS